MRNERASQGLNNKPTDYGQEVKLNFFSCRSFPNLQIRRLFIKKENPQGEKEKDLLYMRKHPI